MPDCSALFISIVNLKRAACHVEDGFNVQKDVMEPQRFGGMTNLNPGPSKTVNLAANLEICWSGICRSLVIVCNISHNSDASQVRHFYDQSWALIIKNFIVGREKNTII